MIQFVIGGMLGHVRQSSSNVSTITFTIEEILNQQPKLHHPMNIRLKKANPFLGQANLQLKRF